MDANAKQPTLAEVQEQLKTTRAQSRLIEERLRLTQLQRLERRHTHDHVRWLDPLLEAKRANVLESADQWDYLSTYQDLLDRLRSPDGILLTPFSTAFDRAYGRNWPFWLTWQDHARLRGISRLLVGMSHQAEGALGGLSAFVVAEGCTYHWTARKGMDPPAELLATLNTLTEEFLELNEFSLLEGELFRRQRRDGESFLRGFVQDGGETILRTVEPEYVMECPRSDLGYTDLASYSFGLYNQADDLVSVEAYAVSPEGSPAQAEFVPVQSEDGWLMHAKIGVDRAIKRGMPDFVFDTYDQLKTAARAIGNMGEATAIHAGVAMIVQHEKAVAGDIQTLQQSLQSYTKPDPFTGQMVPVQRQGPGTRYDVPKGMTWVDPPFGRSNSAYIDAVQMLLRTAGVKWNAPEWLLSGDASNNNYSSSITAESPFVKRCKQFQHLHTVGTRQVNMRAAKAYCNAGRLLVNGRRYTWDEVRRLCQLQVEAPTIEVRKALEEAQTNGVYLQAKVKSPQTIQQEQGLDPEQELTNWDEWNERTGGQGQELPLPGEEGAKKPGPFEESRRRLAPECGGEGGTPGPCPTGDGDKPTAGELPHADDHAKSILAKAGGALKGAARAAVAKTAAFAVARYEKLESEFGRKGAIAILGATVVLTPVPLPGTSLAPIAAAKAYTYLKAKLAKAPLPAGEARESEPSVGDVRAFLTALYQVAGEDPPAVTPDQVRAALGRHLDATEAVQAPVPLAIPDVRQSADYDCGAAALRAVAQFFGVAGDQGDFVAALGSSPAEGTGPEQLIAGAKALSLNATDAAGMTVDYLAQVVAHGRPVICCIQAYGTPDQYARDESGHWVVVCGVDDQSVYVQDPAAGPGKIPVADFEARWHDKTADGRQLVRYGIAVWK